jgi:hypothetical protein
MAIARSTRNLVDRALARREAVQRADLAGALREQAARAAEEARLDAAIAREEAQAALADPLLSAAAWRAAAAARLLAARATRAQAEADCDARREVLADTRRTTRGFEALMAQQDAEARRAAARRDPLTELMLLPGAARPGSHLG